MLRYALTRLVVLALSLAVASLVVFLVLEVVPGSHLFPFTHAAKIAARISDFLDAPAGQQAAA